MTGYKKTSYAGPGPAPNREVAEIRFARRIAGHLTERSEDLPHDITERLRVARLRAVDRARELRKLSSAPAWHAQGDGSAALSGPSWWLRLASAVPVALLVVGLFLIQRTYVEQQIHAAAEVDEGILTDDLPPQAYSDPGFAEFLKSPRSVE